MIDIVKSLRRIAEEGYRFAGDAADEIERLRSRLEAAEKSDAESLAMYRKARGERDALRASLEAAEKERDNANAAAVGIALEVEKLEDERDALRAALRHEADCVEACKSEIDALRAKIAEMERQKPVGKFVQHPSNGLWEQDGYGDNPDANPLYALPGAQQCKNCNGMGDRFDPSGEKIPCDLCESHLEEIRSFVAEAAHDIISGSDFWLSISLAAKKIYALPGAKGEEK